MTTKITKFIIASAFLTTICVALSLTIFSKRIVSANLTSVSDTLSTSQLSYFARLAVGTSTGQSVITIETADNPSNTTNNLFVGDTIAIGTGSTADTSLTNYIVNDIGNTATIQLTTGIGQSNAVADVAIIATRSAIHTITFTPESSLTNGTFEVLIRATDTSGEDYNDGIPDQGGFDMGQDVGVTIGTGTRIKEDDITCPTISGAVWSKTITNVSLNGDTYHSFACTHTSGAGNTNALTSYTMTIGRDLATGSQLINPAPALSHTEGTASPNVDTYSFYVRHKNAAEEVIDITQGKIAVVESVRVTATVDPSLTFTIDTTGVGVGTTPCENTLGSAAGNTTATAVNFGSLSLAAFNDLAQHLSCVTNASGGYTVTAFTNSELTNINTGVTIPHTDCDADTCTQTTSGAWITDNSTSGFGYSIQNIDANTVDFSYGGTGLFAAKPFGDGYSNARMIFQNSSTPTTTEDIYMCYRLSVDTNQEAGEYENHITYTATATF